MIVNKVFYEKDGKVMTQRADKQRKASDFYFYETTQMQKIKNS